MVSIHAQHCKTWTESVRTFDFVQKLQDQFEQGNDNDVNKATTSKSSHRRKLEEVDILNWRSTLRSNSFLFSIPGVTMTNKQIPNSEVLKRAEELKENYVKQNILSWHVLQEIAKKDRVPSVSRNVLFPKSKNRLSIEEETQK